MPSSSATRDPLKMFPPPTTTASSAPASAPNLPAPSKADLERVAGEASHHDVLPDLLDGLLQEVADGLVRLPDVGLRQQGSLRGPLLHPTLGDAASYVLGLVHLCDLLLDDLTLLLEFCGRDVLRGHGEGLRLCRGHVQRHVVR